MPNIDLPDGGAVHPGSPYNITTTVTINGIATYVEKITGTGTLEVNGTLKYIAIEDSNLTLAVGKEAVFQKLDSAHNSTDYTQQTIPLTLPLKDIAAKYVLL